jgi:hypothetical protein
MRLTARDGLATAFVAAAVLVYTLWATDTAMQGTSTRMLAAIILGLGVAACSASQREMAVVYGVDRTRPRPPMGYVVAASALGVGMLVAGVIALVTASEAMLATLVVAMVALWVLATSRHWLAARAPGSRPLSGRPL